MSGESREAFERDRFGTAGPRMCAGNSPGQTYGKRRILAMAQRCGAYAEEGQRYCPVHLKASGWTRCATCGAWAEPAPMSYSSLHICPNSCPQPSVREGVQAAIDAVTEARR